MLSHLFKKEKDGIKRMNEEKNLISYKFSDKKDAELKAKENKKQLDA